MTMILVTGASGFIGRELVKRLTAGGSLVTGMSNRKLLPDCSQCDIVNTGQVEELCALIDPDVIVHCAAFSGVASGSALDYYSTNVLGTENIVRAAARLKKGVRFIFLSTAGVYGNQDREFLDETLTPKPVHHYGLSKFSAERIIYNYADNIDFTIVRPFNVIGTGQNPLFIVPKLVRHYLERRAVIELGNIDVYRDYIDVSATAEILIQLIGCRAASGEVVNLCTGQGTSIRDLMRALEELTGHSITIAQSEKFMRPNEIWKLLGDCTKLDRLLPNRYSAAPLSHVLHEMLGGIPTAGKPGAVDQVRAGGEL